MTRSHPRLRCIAHSQPQHWAAAFLTRACPHSLVHFRTSQVVAIVMIVPIRVYHGQNISVPIVVIQSGLTAGNLGNTWIATITPSETSIPTTTGAERPLGPNTANAKPPAKAPLVNPRKENAAFN